MPWWGWLIVGIVLIGIELTAADLAFYLVFIGAAAVVVGVLEAGGAGLPATGQWLLFAVLAVGTMLLFRERLYTRLRTVPGFDNAAAGPAGTVAIDEDVPPGGTTRVALRGTQWDARNIGATPIKAGERAQVVKTEGNMLGIASATPHPAAGEDGPPA